MRRVTKILSLAALAAIGSHTQSANAANLTWTGAVNNTWDANNSTAGTFGTANWTSGGAAATYNQGDNVTFTDNFTGPTGIDAGTLNYSAFNFTAGLNPQTLTFGHIAGTTPTNYTLNRFRNNNTSTAANSSPFGISNTTTLVLDTGFLGKVTIQSRAASSGGTLAFGNTIVRSGILELQDSNALPNGTGPLVTSAVSNQTPSATLDGGALYINPLNFVASTDNGVTPYTTSATNASSSTLAGTLTVSSNSTLAYNSTFDNASLWNGTITIASNATLKVTSLTGNAYRFQGISDFQQSSGTILFENTGALANFARVETFRASPTFASLDLGQGSTVFAVNATPGNLVGATGGTLSIGALYGGVNTRLNGNNGSTANIIDTYNIGLKNTDSLFDGTIADGTATTNVRKLSISKSGTGVLTLTGANTYSGSSNAAGGTFQFATVGNAGVTSNLGSGTQLFLTGGALKHTGAAASTDRLVNVNATGGTLDSSGGGISFTNAAVKANDAASRGGYINPGSNVLSFAPPTANANGLGNTTDLVVGMQVNNSIAFPGGPAIITAVGLGTVTLDQQAVAGGTIANNATTFSVVDRTLNLTGISTGSMAGTLSNSIGGGKLNLAKSGTGSWLLSGANASTGSVSATGGTLTFANTSNLSKGAVSANGGSIVLATGHTSANSISSLSIGATNSAVDLTDNDLVVASGTSKTAVEGYVRSARNAGAWDQAGLTTSIARPTTVGLVQPTGLAVVSATEFTSVNPAANTVFSGVALAGTETLVKYTWNGDADLNGKIDANDYARIDAGFQNQNTVSGFVRDYFTGNFDYNNIIDANDYALIDAAFVLQNGTLRPAIDFLQGNGGSLTQQDLDSAGMQMVIDHFNEFGGSYASAFLQNNVPEPTTIGVIGVATAGLLARRRRRSM